ncbi:MAG: hypothetical protein HY038_09525, partial [Nitrospirae bacterium]|nr:hypothetical protein [Nitrospirota bacterium]
MPTLTLLWRLIGDDWSQQAVLAPPGVAQQSRHRFAAGAPMSFTERSSLPTALVFALLALGLAGCATSNPFSSSGPEAPAPVQ